MSKDPYQILGVEKHASAADIRRAYSAIAKRYHPDRNPGNKAALDKFVEATEAYETLSNSDRRTVADAELRRARDMEAVAFDTWGAPQWDAPAGNQKTADDAPNELFGEDPWNEPPYGTIAAVVALFCVAGLVLAAFFFT